MIVQELALDQPAHDGVAAGHKDHIAAVGADVHRLFVVVGQQVGHFGHGLAGHDDADVLHGGDRALHDGKTVAVQCHHGQLVGQDLEQLTGVGGLFLVLTDSI